MTDPTGPVPARMPPPRWLTSNAWAVIAVLDRAVEAEPAYGTQICRATGLGPGTVHPILQHLTAAGWAESWTKPAHQGDQPRPGGPPRRYYRLTDTGRTAMDGLAPEPAPPGAPGGQPNVVGSQNPPVAARPAIGPGRQALNTALAARYDEGETIRDLADHTRTSYGTVHDGLVHENVTLRPTGSRRNHHRDPAAPLRIGYSMGGPLTSGIPDTPANSHVYRRGVIDAMQAAGNQVVLLPADCRRLGTGHRYRCDDKLPDLDAIVFEWQGPLPGRTTTVCGSDGHHCDLHRRQELLGHYTHGRRTPTVIWDQDRQLPTDDPLRLLPQARVAENALRPTSGAVTVTVAVPDQLLAQADPATLARQDRTLPLVYVGDQRGRDTPFARYIAPAAAAFKHRVAGNWPTQLTWPHVTVTGGCRSDEVAGIYATALATVLLLPDQYAAVGHLTSQLYEAVTRGCLPLTPADITCADQITPTELHVHDGADVIAKLRWLQDIRGTREHHYLIAACLLHLRRYRLSAQVGTLLDTLHALTEQTPATSGASR